MASGGVLWLFYVSVVAVVMVTSLDNGAAPTPPMGWSSWDAFQFKVNATVLKHMADLMVSTGLQKAGYTYLLLDDGWPACDRHHLDGSCAVVMPRDPKTNRIVVNREKFPKGLEDVSSYCHSKGLKFGIYTAPHKITCGGYTASLGYEAVDAASFADWGIDFVKLDAGCQNDCSIHDGCIIESLTKMRDGLNATGRKMVYYVDDGNPTSGPKVYNPHKRGWPDNARFRSHFATEWSEYVAAWGPGIANMWKLWLDRADTWESLLTNVHQQLGLQWFQDCNAYNNPDFLTVGLGGMSEGQYRAEMFLYTALGAPLIVSFDLTRVDNFTKDLVTNPELLAANQDTDCVQGTMVRAWGATELWIKPLKDASYVCVLLNKGDHDQDMEIRFADFRWATSDFFPLGATSGNLRDLYRRKDLGTFHGSYHTTVPGIDAHIVLVKLM